MRIRAHKVELPKVEDPWFDLKCFIKLTKIDIPMQTVVYPPGTWFEQDLASYYQEVASDVRKVLLSPPNHIEKSWI